MAHAAFVATLPCSCLGRTNSTTRREQSRIPGGQRTSLFSSDSYKADGVYKLGQTTNIRWRMQQTSPPPQRPGAEGEGSLPDFDEILAKDWGALNHALESSDFGREAVAEEKSLRRIFVEENEGSGGYFTHAIDKNDGKSSPVKKKRGRKKKETVVEKKVVNKEEKEEEEAHKDEEAGRPKLNKLGGRPMMVPKRDIEKLKREPVWYREPKWFFLQTRPGFEHNVGISVKNAANNLEHLKVYDVVIPQTKTMRLSASGKAVKKDERIFPGYMMINMIMDKKSYNDIRSIPNCQGFMNDPNRDKSKKQPIRPPLPASNAEVAAVFTKLREQEVGDPEEKFALRPGDWVDVTVEPHKDKRGKVMQVKPDLGIVVTRLVMYGRYTNVELHYNEFEKVNRSEIDPETGDPYEETETEDETNTDADKENTSEVSNEDAEIVESMEGKPDPVNDEKTGKEHANLENSGSFKATPRRGRKKITIAEEVSRMSLAGGDDENGPRDDTLLNKPVDTTLSAEEQKAALADIADDEFTEADIDFFEPPPEK